MMDLSDGISKDAATLCHENRLGLELSLENLAPPRDMLALSEELRIPWQQWVLHGGEEYELLFAAADAWSGRGLKENERAGMVRIGRFTDKPKGIWARENGTMKRVAMKSWDHAGR